MGGMPQISERQWVKLLVQPDDGATPLVKDIQRARTKNAVKQAVKEAVRDAVEDAELSGKDH